MSGEGTPPGRLAEVVDSLSGLDRSERIDALIDLAGRFRDVPESVARRPFPAERKVPACESEAYLFSEPLADGTLRFHFAVENPQGLSAKALAVLIDRALSGAPLADVAQAGADPVAVVEAIFGRELSLGKQMGLSGMLQSVQREARAHLESHPPG